MNLTLEGHVRLLKRSCCGNLWVEILSQNFRCPSSWTGESNDKCSFSTGM